MAKLGIYAGSFDPITVGHFDVVDQALEIFDQVEIAVGSNPSKKNRLLDKEYSVDLIRQAVEERYPNPQSAERVIVTFFEGTLVRYAEERKACALIRGLRQVSDFNDEFVLNGANAMLSPMPMVYFICRTQYIHVSSSVVRELGKLGEDFSALVPPCVVEPVRERYAMSKFVRGE